MFLCYLNCMYVFLYGLNCYMIEVHQSIRQPAIFKMVKIYNLFQSKTAQKPYPLGPHIQYLCNPHTYPFGTYNPCKGQGAHHTSLVVLDVQNTMSYQVPLRKKRACNYKVVIGWSCLDVLGRNFQVEKMAKKC